MPFVVRLREVQATADLIRAQDPTIPLHPRDPIEIKGKGLMVKIKFANFTHFFLFVWTGRDGLIMYAIDDGISQKISMTPGL